MTMTLPKLVTFDGEARSGKGTRVQYTKDYLRDECGYKVMLIDAGQVFRVLVVAVLRNGVDLEDPTSIDAFLCDPVQVEACAKLVRDVYHMPKMEREELLYTNEVGRGSAMIGARPLAQDFKDRLLRKWLRDAAREGFEVVLLDGRALEEVGTALEREGLCQFVLGLYFVCDPVVGARRTLGFGDTPYEQLPPNERTAVDELVTQVRQRNDLDRQRSMHQVVPPQGAPTFNLPDIPSIPLDQKRHFYIFDTSADKGISEMTRPVAQFVSGVLRAITP